MADYGMNRDIVAGMLGLHIAFWLGEREIEGETVEEPHENRYAITFKDRGLIGTVSHAAGDRANPPLVLAADDVESIAFAVGNAAVEPIRASIVRVLKGKLADTFPGLATDAINVLAESLAAECARNAGAVLQAAISEAVL